MAVSVMNVACCALRLRDHRCIRALASGTALASERSSFAAPVATQMQELPLSWLVQLVATIKDKQAKVSLHRTCKLLRDLILMAADRVQCLLDIKTVTPTQAARSLQLLATCKEGAEVKLVLKDSAAGYITPYRPAMLDSWLNTLCTEYGSSLAPITHVDLQVNERSGDLVPPGLSTFCPKLSRFTRQAWYPGYTRRDLGSLSERTHRQLQHLSLHAPPTAFGRKEAQHQFSLLPNLQSLHCFLLNEEFYDMPPPPRLAYGMQPLYPYLKSLRLDNCHVPLSHIVSKPWQQLQHLRVPSAAVDDITLELLLDNAPQVTDMEVSSFQFDENHADRSCKWRNLTTHTITCESLVNMPVAALDRLHIAWMSLDHSSWQHMPAASAILAKIPRNDVAVYPTLYQPIPKPQPIEVGTSPNLFTEPSNASQLLALLQSLRQDHFAFHPWGDVEPQFFEFLGQLACRALTLQTDALLESHWGELLQQMPSLQVLHMRLPPSSKKYTSWDKAIAELTTPLFAFCVHASRPCTLWVSNQLATVLQTSFEYGWQTKLKDAMQAAGHQHVALEIGE